MAGALMTPSLHRRAQHSTRTWGAARIPLAIGDPGEGMEHLWSPAAQPVATGGKWNTPKNRSNKPIRNRWQPTATVSERMVRRGSTVRVRQRALHKRRTSALSRSRRLAPRRRCGGYGALDGAFGAETVFRRATSRLFRPRTPRVEGYDLQAAGEPAYADSPSRAHAEPLRSRN